MRAACVKRLFVRHLYRGSVARNRICTICLKLSISLTEKKTIYCSHTRKPHADKTSGFAMAEGPRDSLSVEIL